MNGRGQQAENGSSLKIERWTHSFSLGVQQTRTLSSPIWSPTLLVSITSNARSGGKPFAHRERASPVHKLTFKQRRNRTRKKKRSKSGDFFCRVLAAKSATATWSKKKGFLSKHEIALLVYHTFHHCSVLHENVTNTKEISSLCIPHIAWGPQERTLTLRKRLFSLAFEKHTCYWNMNV